MTTCKSPISARICEKLHNLENETIKKIMNQEFSRLISVDIKIKAGWSYTEDRDANECTHHSLNMTEPIMCIVYGVDRSYNA